MEEKTKDWTIFWFIWTRALAELTRCHTSIARTLLLIFMTFKLNIKCLRQHHATSNHLEITKIERSQVSNPIVETTHSLRKLQPGNRKNPFKPKTEEFTNLLSALQDFTKFPLFKNTHPLTRLLVKERNCLCQSSISNDQATGPKRNKTNYKQTNSIVEVS